MNSPKIDIVEIKENEDGSCTVVFDMDSDLVVHFAKIGLLKVLLDAAKDIVEDK